MKASIRPAAMAGMFYPADPLELDRMIKQLITEAKTEGEPPKAIVAPHAGYIYSGPVAASIYKLLLPLRGKIKRVVILGPAHRVPFFGLAVPSMDAFATPLGLAKLDKPVIEQLARLPFVQVYDEAHKLEHSLEVQIPFIQEVLGDVQIVPIVIGQADPDMVAAVIEPFLLDDETLVVISSDLSHYHDYNSANTIDLMTTKAIEELRDDAISHEQACGATGIRGLLKLAKKYGLTPKTVDLRNSGDTAGDKDRVVGYGAYAFY